MTTPPRKTLIVCNHYDVQPTEPLEEWEYDPFAATIVGDRKAARESIRKRPSIVETLFAEMKGPRGRVAPA